MQELMLSDELFDAIDYGTKRGTVRSGKRDIVPGDLLLRSARGTRMSRVVEVARVSYVEAGRLTVADAVLDGLASAAELMAVLRRYYPSLGAADLVTVVEFA